jgi:ubiquinone/menaquinone biosynthesis C-methylase UbiE
MDTSTTFVAADGDGYELQMGRWSRRLAPLFIDFAGITDGECILDVGCGTGNLTFALSQNSRIGAIQGIDLSPIYVEHARANARDPRLDFQIGDACTLPFADASFDHALSLLVLQFIPKPDLAVREMCRVTRPGGTVAAATWDARGGYVAHRIIFDTAAMIDQKGNDRRAKAYTRPMSRPGELARAWRDAGLKDVTQDMLTIRMDFESFADFWAPAEAKDGPIAEYVGALGIEARVELREKVKLAYLDGEGDGARSYAATAWVVRGKACTRDDGRD